MGNIKITFEEHDNIIQQYESGMEINDIASKYNVQPQSIRKILRKYNINIESKIQRFHKLYDNEIIQLSLEGWSNRQIADKYGVDHNTISKILYNNGIDHARTRFHNSNDIDIIELYLNGTPVVDIARRYNVDKATIYSICDKYNIPRKKAQFHDEFDIDIIRLYDEGYSTNEIATIYGVCHNTIADIVRTYSSIRSTSERHRKYTIDEHYFDEIDTPNKAYILGILYADGTNDECGRIALSLQERDIDILQKIQKEIGSNEPLNYREFKKVNENWSNQWRMFINNKHISNTLSKYGVVKNKTFVVEYPRWLDDSLHSHFIRGMIDGDGSITQNYISLAGTYDICYIAGEILKDKCDIQYTIYASNNIYSLRIYRKIDRIKVLSFLYKDADLFLNRKYNEYVKFMNYINNSDQINELVS